MQSTPTVQTTGLNKYSREEVFLYPYILQQCLKIEIEEEEGPELLKSVGNPFSSSRRLFFFSSLFFTVENIQTIIIGSFASHLFPNIYG